METETKQERDWRDSLITKVVAYALTGALVLGAGKLYYEMDRKGSQENCQRYGWLMDKSKEEQKKQIRKDLESRSRLFRWSPPLGMNEGLKDYSITLIMKDLEKNCKSKNCKF